MIMQDGSPIGDVMTNADQELLSSVHRAAYGQRITTTVPAVDSRNLPALQPAIDSCPITPVIQTQPDILQAARPTAIVRITNSADNTIVYADSSIPGFQPQPGMITPTRPSAVVGKIGNSGYENALCWLLPLLGILLFGALLSGLYHFSGSRQEAKQWIIKAARYRYECGSEFMLNGKCITCPTGSRWDGRSCNHGGKN